MGMLDRLKTHGAPAISEQAVIVKYNFASGDLDRIFQLEDQLANAVEKASAGEFDGNEIAVDGRDNLFYMYGPDADKIYDAIEPVLLSWDILSQAQVLLRYGPPGLETRQRTVTLPAFSNVQH